MCEELRPEDFKVNRHQAAKFLGISYKALMKLGLPYYQVGTSFIRFRKVDLERVRNAGIHCGKAAQV